MLIKQAKEIASQWVFEEASKLPGFYGAYFAGSINWKSDDESLPPMSDVDIKIIIDDSNSPNTYRKSLYRNVLLEVSYGPSSDYQSPETVLSSYYTAKHFTTPSIISDPSGQLAKIQTIVSKEYAKRHWVQKRCEHAQDWMFQSLQWFNPSAPLHDQVFAWVYPCSMLAQIVMVADLRNPTVRQMYVVAQDVFAKYDQLVMHEALLTLIGSAKMNRVQVEALLGSCTEALDLAKQFVKTPFFGSTNITDYGRPTVVEGTQDMIERGFHREAVFWIIMNHSWCQKALYNDAPVEVQRQVAPGYQHLLTSIGISSTDDLQKRNGKVKDIVPHIWELVETILDANLAIID